MRIAHPLEINARNKVHHAIRLGKLARAEKCSVIDCSYTKVEAHHFLGYEPEHWLNVQWLCKKHHVEADKLMEERYVTA